MGSEMLVRGTAFGGIIWMTLVFKSENGRKRFILCSYIGKRDKEIHLYLLRQCAYVTVSTHGHTTVTDLGHVQQVWFPFTCGVPPALADNSDKAIGPTDHGLIFLKPWAKVIIPSINLCFSGISWLTLYFFSLAIVIGAGMVTEWWARWCHLYTDKSTLSHMHTRLC